MTGRLSRRKGKRGEREVATLLREALPWFANAVRRGWQSRAGDDECDVEGTPWWIECKRGKAPNIRKALAQADTDTDGRAPVVFTRRDREGWVVSMHAKDWLQLVRSFGGEQ